MLWLCLYLPSLSLEVFDSADARKPFAVSEARAIHACNAAAGRAGVRAGMRVSAAHALVEGLIVQPRNETMERETLARLAAWAGQFTSAVSLEPPRALLLEVGGSLALFGGMEKLRTRIDGEMRALGYAARLAAAPTPLGALLLARTDREISVDDAGTLHRALADLPVGALDLPARARERLGVIGVRTFGECLRLPRAGLARRFGPEFLDYLDRALGQKADPRRPYEAPAHFAARVAFPEPVAESEALLFALRRLLIESTGFARARDAGIPRLSVLLAHHAPPPTTFAVGLAAPSRDAAHLLLLVREHFARRSLREPVHEVGLEVPELVAWEAGSDSLLDAGPAHADPRRLLERLQARLGHAAVHGVGCAPEHRPERALCVCEPGEAKASAIAPRPLWFFERPAPLACVEGRPYLHGPLRLCQGPERIESGWWDGDDVTRDYFIAEDADGARFWVFRERVRHAWFLHGVFA